MQRARSQEGIALVTILIMLVIITLLSLSAIRVSTMELNMARNQESKAIAFNTAQALSDAIVVTSAGTAVTGDVGHLVCTAEQAGCNEANLTTGDAYLDAAIVDGTLNARVRRLGPALRPPPRGVASSADKFMAAAFEIRTTYDNTDDGQGSAGVAEGVLVLVPIN